MGSVRKTRNTAFIQLTNVLQNMKQPGFGLDFADGAIFQDVTTIGRAHGGPHRTITVEMTSTVLIAPG